MFKRAEHHPPLALLRHSALAIITFVGVGACALVPVGIGMAHDNPFEPGVVLLDEETCDRHGGTSLTDASEDASDSGEKFGVVDCRIGEPIATYACDDSRRVARLRQAGSDQELLQSSDIQYEIVSAETSETGARWSGEHLTVVETDFGVIVTTAEWRSVCDKIPTEP